MTRESLKRALRSNALAIAEQIDVGSTRAERTISARAKTFWRWKSRCARHMDAVGIACTKPLLLREAVKEAVASGRVEKLQPKVLQTWKTTRRVGKSFANGWRFRNHSPMDGASEGQATVGKSGRGLRQKGRRTSFSAVAASRTTESWDGCCLASAGRDGPPGRSDPSDLVSWRGALILSGTTSALGAVEIVSIDAIPATWNALSPSVLSVIACPQRNQRHFQE